jgi:hypothetical protein
MSPELTVEWDALSVEHQRLQKVQRSLEGRPHDHAAHQEHLRNLHAHTERVRDFGQRLHREHERSGLGTDD